MTNAIPVTDAFAQSNGGTFVNKDEKAELYATQTPMYIVDVEPNSDSVYGAQTVFHVKAKAWGRDTTRLLAFAHSPFRETLATNIKTLMTQTPGKPAGPIYLWKYTTKAGNEAWDIKPEPYKGDTTPKPIAAITSTEPAPTPIADDDLPF